MFRYVLPSFDNMRIIKSVYNVWQLASSSSNNKLLGNIIE